MDDSDIICACEEITYGEIKSAVAGGATSLEKVQEMTHAGTVCGQCEDDLRSYVAQLLKK
ncbi:BFD-like [2Fe-2S] binding protein [Heliophilum fasciatum]|uniref:BFD-like [2Fe-2S] binding protein n=2 Tax=Heliophilum fasciatum TaxID=35700 RepID=A0A4R2RNU9_9FIRM|nr:BFD-like [2Fe-2S] binding protein [Heliophilum fasciatum]